MGIAKRRELRNYHIKRKQSLCRALYGDSIKVGDTPGSFYKHNGQYSKNKITCDCKLCKPGRHFKLPTVRMARESEAEKIDMREFNTEKYELFKQTEYCYTKQQEPELL